MRVWCETADIVRVGATASLLQRCRDGGRSNSDCKMKWGPPRLARTITHNHEPRQRLNPFDRCRHRGQVHHTLPTHICERNCISKVGGSTDELRTPRSIEHRLTCLAQTGLDPKVGSRPV